MDKNSYLERGLEPQKQSEYLEPDVLQTEMTDKEFGVEGEFGFTTGGINFNISYSTPDASDPDVRYFSLGNAITDYRKLNHFRVSSGSKDLMNLSLKDMVVLFATRKNDLDEGGTDFNNKVFVVYLLTTPLGIIAFLHEMGHVKDKFAISNYKKLKEARVMLDEGIDRDQAELILRTERNAWSWAVKMLKPLMRELPEYFEEKKVMDYVHKRGLASYSEQIREFIIEDSGKIAL